MAQDAMPAVRTQQRSLRELRRCARGAARLPVRLSEIRSLIDRLFAGGEIVSIEERDGAVVIRFRVAGGQALSCVLDDRDHAAHLTPGEHAVAGLLCDGLTHAQIARLRGVSINTVKSQARQVFRKLDVGNRVALVRRLGP